MFAGLTLNLDTSLNCEVNNGFEIIRFNILKVILETERLILREFALSDAGKFYELNANKEVLRYTGDLAFDSVIEAEES